MFPCPLAGTLNKFTGLANQSWLDLIEWLPYLKRLKTVWYLSFLPLLSRGKEVLAASSFKYWTIQPSFDLKKHLP